MGQCASDEPVKTKPIDEDGEAWSSPDDVKTNDLMGIYTQLRRLFDEIHVLEKECLTEIGSYLRDDGTLHVTYNNIRYQRAVTVFLRFRRLERCILNYYLIVPRKYLQDTLCDEDQFRPFYKVYNDFMPGDTRATRLKHLRGQIDVLCGYIQLSTRVDVKNVKNEPDVN